MTENDGNDVEIPVDDETEVMAGPFEDGATSVEDLEEGDEVHVVREEDGAAERIGVLPDPEEMERRFEEMAPPSGQALARPERLARPARRAGRPDPCRPPRRSPMGKSRPVSGNVLVVEDEQSIADLARAYLARDGYSVVWVRSGEEALAEIGRQPIRLVILDIGLPGEIDGFEVCRRLRARSGVPILILSARGDEVDRVAGLEAGADDYVPKPFSPRELVARVKAILRRAPERAAGEHGETLSAGDVVLEHPSRSVTAGGEPVKLTAREFDLLAALLAHPNVVLEPRPPARAGLGRLVSRRYADGRRPRRPAAAKARPSGADRDRARDRLPAGGAALMRSLRRQLFAAILGAVLLAVGVSLAVGILLTRDATRDAVEDNLAREADGLAARFETVPRDPRWSRRARARTAAARRAAAGALAARTPRRLLPEERGRGAERAASRRAAPSRSTAPAQIFEARAVGDAVVIATRPDIEDGDDFRNFLSALLIASGLAILLAGGVAALLSRRLAEPLGRVAEASRVLAAGKSPEPLPRERTEELSALADAFNAMAAQLERAREAERSVLLSVSHDLRTPLTAVQGYAEGIEDGTLEPGAAAVGDRPRVEAARAARRRPARAGPPAPGPARVPRGAGRPRRGPRRGTGAPATAGGGGRGRARRGGRR